MEHDPTRFHFLLVPGFSLVALSCAIDTLRAANVEAGREVFSWAIIGQGNQPIQSSSGIAMPYLPLTMAGPADAVAVCGGERSHLFHNTGVETFLKDCARSGQTVGSLSDGAYVVAGAGLFDRVRSTIHWKCQSGYRERFPDLDIRTSIFEIDGTRFSCAGGTSSLDLMLQFVARKLGVATVGKIADNYFHDVVRGDDQVQHMTSAFRYAARDKVLTDALLIMEGALELPIEIGEIASMLKVSHRQLDRVFRRSLGASPSHYYRDMRITRASGLLKQTGLSVGEIALACGFQSASHLSRHFKRKFDMSPNRFRNGS